jgi:hypothetical protein
MPLSFDGCLLTKPNQRSVVLPSFPRRLDSDNKHPALNEHNIAGPAFRVTSCTNLNR